MLPKKSAVAALFEKLTKKKRFADIQNNDKAAALLNFAETKNK